jgi:hypothetical protein
MASKFMKRIRDEEGAVRVGEYDPLSNCLQSQSPSVNWAYGLPGHGLPFGNSMILYGPPKGGKSIICNSYIGQLHKDDPEALAITFNTEMRAEIQANEAQLATWGIDKDRFQAFDRNTPEGIFDFIEHDVAAACQEGEKVRLIIIDSMNGIQGRRSLNADSVSQQQIGDEAMTLQVGLKRILPTIRKYRIGLVLTAHIRAELDQAEQMRGNKVKMGMAWASKHFAEIFAYVEPNKSKDGKTTLDGVEFSDPEIKDFMGKEQKTGHKIRFKVTESSIGPAGRTAEFTLDYDRGIVNQYEEIFMLGKNMGVIKKPNNLMYEFEGQQWKGLANMLTAMRDDPELARRVLTQVYTKDCREAK